MNDQISRQKLIEELENEILQICKNSKSDRYHAGMIAGIERVIEKIKSQPPVDVPDTNVGEYIDTGCGVEVIHTISQTKVPKHLKFTKDGEIVKDFILCKNPAGEVGYYETVAGIFYGIDMEVNGND